MLCHWTREFGEKNMKLLSLPSQSRAQSAPNGSLILNRANSTMQIWKAWHLATAESVKPALEKFPCCWSGKEKLHNVALVKRSLSFILDHPTLRDYASIDLCSFDPYISCQDKDWRTFLLLLLLFLWTTELLLKFNPDLMRQHLCLWTVRTCNFQDGTLLTHLQYWEK